jgi:transcriptional regulator with PAS, ATPase and Fis domain
MDCSFTLCSAQDTVETVSKKMLIENSFFAVITDGKNRYSGIVTANDLLGINNDTLIEPLVHKIEPVSETDSLMGLKTVKSDILPVINMNDNVVGVVSLRSLIEYLPQLLTLGETVRSPGLRRPNQLSAKYTINDIVGQSKSILQLKEQIIAAAKTKSTVLILGETGTGKELIAHAIHRLSNRRHNPFVRVNCAAIPDNLLESELFGYESGAFTGAMKGGQTGKFEMADEGTIFLDEIGDMPLALQAKILRVLQEKEIEKIGGRAPIPLNVRILAATHRNLQTLVKENKFREDLYFRLHVIPIEIPPLRNHREDIPILTDYFLQKFSDDLEVPKPKVDRDFLTALVEYDWPGNVRELANTMELTLGLHSGTLTVDKLPSQLKTARTTNPEEIDDNAQLKRCADEAEREAILKALEYHKGNKLKVCDALGISRSSLYNKLKKYEIDA